MFGFRKKQQKQPEQQAVETLENGDVKISFPIDDKMAEELDALRDNTITGEIDVMSVIEGFLSEKNHEFDGMRVSPEAAVASSEVEEVDAEIGEMDLRLYALNDIMLHYYLSNCHSWLEAIFTALDEVPALCLSVPGSPVEYLSDPSEADEITKNLGYDNWSNLAETMSSKMSANPFLMHFAEYTLDFAKQNWFTDLADVSPSTYAEAIVNELRANAPAAKASAASFIDRVLETLPDGVFRLDDGTDGVACGIETVDSNWMPHSISIMRKDHWEEKCKKFEEYASKKADIAKAQGKSEIDEDILSVVYLQSYSWSNRSWNKATELAEDFLNSCFTFCMSCVSPEYKVIDIDKVEQNSERLDELAKELMNDNGQIELRQIRPGAPQDLSTLDAVSREFVELNEEQGQAQFVSEVNQIISNLMPALAGLHPTVADMLIDEIMTCVWADADLSKDTSQLKTMQELHMATIEKMKAKAKTYKAYWKKYLSKDDGAAEAVKSGYAITSYDDGVVKFIVP